ncbi:hypothetical protein [Sorangium sp. So ce1024]|uniref:hypothetical protein n=1 Tax=Sorangium sp. So ce1024 TaxID=3133327 RepID=UPI003F00D5BE
MSESVKTWRYYLRGPDLGWAEILLTSSGMFAATSDYGHYAHPWRSFGERDFREFVASLSGSWNYVAGKLSRRSEYQGPETLARLKRHIVDARRFGGLTSEDAREIWDELSEYNIDDDVFGFSHWLRESDGASKIGDAFEFAVYDYPSDVKAFCRKILPRLAEVLRAELEAEKRAEACALGGPADTHAPGM